MSTGILKNLTADKKYAFWSRCRSQSLSTLTFLHLLFFSMVATSGEEQNILSFVASHLPQPCSMANDDIPNLQTTCLHNWSPGWPAESRWPLTLRKLSHISLLWAKEKWKWWKCRRISVGSKDWQYCVSDSAWCHWRVDQRSLLSFKPILQLLLPASWCSPPPDRYVGSHQG